VKLQTQTFNKRLANPYPVNADIVNVNPLTIPSSPLLSNAMKGLQFWDPNTRQTSVNRIDLSSYAADLNISKSLRDVNEKCMAANIDDLINSTDYSSKFRCGWLYKKGDPGYTPATSVGYAGTKEGPATFYTNNPPPTKHGETWFWDLDEAKKTIMKDRCFTLTSCSDVGSTNYKNCAYSTTRGTGIPVDAKGRVAYPDDAALTAPAGSLVATPASCPALPAYGTPAYNLARSRDVCIPNEDGTLSRDCMLSQITAAGCKTDGTLYALMNQSTVPGNYSAGLSDTLAYKTYQARSQVPLLDSILRNGKTTKDIALSNFKELNNASNKGDNSGLNYAARDLCMKSGIIDMYDFCSEIKDTSAPPFSLECVQSEWRKAGGLPAGTDYPKDVSRINASYSTWGEYKKYCKDLAKMTTSTERTVQKDGLRRFMGVTREPIISNQIPVINGIEIFWINSGTNTFLGRRVTTGSGQFPEFDTINTIIGGTGLNTNIDYYAFANVRPPKTMIIAMNVRTDDGMVWGLNRDFNEISTRGKAIDMTSGPYAAIKTGIFSVNWDQAPTQHISKAPWTIQAGGPNYIMGYYHQAFNFAVSKIQYTDTSTGKTQPFPSDWLTLTQEPDAPMLSWEGITSSDETTTMFRERRLPTAMEIRIGGNASIVQLNGVNKIPAGLKLGATGFGAITRAIGMNAWRTLTMSFVANSGTFGSYPPECGLYGRPNADSSLRAYNQDECDALGGTLYGVECIKPGVISYSGACTPLNNQAAAAFILMYSPIRVIRNGNDIGVSWDGNVKFNTVFKNAVVSDDSTPCYLMINMRSRYDGQYPDTVSVYCGTVAKWNTISKGDIRSFSTEKSAPLFSTSDNGGFYLGDNQGQRSGNVTISAFRLFDYELDFNDMKRDMTNSWLMNYFY